MGDLLQRREGHSHHVTYGRHGALIVTLQPGAADPPRLDAIPARARFGGSSVDETPAWLLTARAALLENPAGQSISHLAARFGVHRVHFSRAFCDHFGVRPSVVRRQAMVSHALALALGKGSRWRPAPRRPDSPIKPI
uniref:HTH araC/xylS-type domain-containing protein n=1 Tax=Phenylobacterium glaciei TaxID=2803784 RepID=A0A974P280_9CAUL|nr:hypothetical protein JKL49_22015 [Phenylobacterium glaciei]